MTTSTPGAFDPRTGLDDLLHPLGLARADAGGRVTLAGADPILAARTRLGAVIGLPILGGAVAAAAVGRRRGIGGQDLHLDLRHAVHRIRPEATWSPTVAGHPAPTATAADNPFLLTPYRTADGRTVMASGVYPHLAAHWCRFLGVPPDEGLVAAAIGRWDAAALEDAASAEGLPCAIARGPAEWLAHPQGALLATEPVIGLERLGAAPTRSWTPAERPLDGVRVLSFTHAIAGPVVGRTLAEQGADVLCVTRPDDLEHDFVYDEANIGSRSTYLDLSTPDGRAAVETLLGAADVVVDNHRPGRLARYGIGPEQLAERHPGIVVVSVSCYGRTGPWAGRGGFDMNGSAASGLMAVEGGDGGPRLPVTGMINDFVTGYLGALGATAALLRRAEEGGSWLVTVSLTRAAMWYPTLGLVDPRGATGPLEPAAYDAPTPLGDLHTLAPPVRFSRTPARWPDPPLVPRGSGRAAWTTDRRIA